MVDIIERDAWGAQHGTGWGERPLPAPEAWLHHTATNPPADGATFADDAAHVRFVEDIGKDRFGDADYDVNGVDQWPGEAGAGISYTTITLRPGRTFRGHDPKRQSSHTKGHNYTGAGIAVAGDFTDIDPGYELLEEIAGTLIALAAEGTIAAPRLNGDHQATGYPTGCAGRLGHHVDTINAIAGGTMSRRTPTLADLRNKEAELRARGFQIYCGPSHHASGACRPGRHPHSSDSRHFAGGALDVGFDPPSGAAVSDYERAHLDLLVREMAADPYVQWRTLWRETSGAHHDHAHFDDRPGWYQVRNYSGVRDGGAVLISPRAFPRHVPSINAGFSLEYIVDVQNRLIRLALYKGTADGYRGPDTQDAIKTFQRSLGLTADGQPGQKTLAALKVALTPQPTPAPAPAPAPTPATPAPGSGFTAAHVEWVQESLNALGLPEKQLEVDGSLGPATQAAVRAFQRKELLEVDGLPGDRTSAAIRSALAALDAGPRLAGADRYATAAAIALQAPEARQAKVYLAAGDGPDATVAASAGDGVVLLARRGSQALPGATADALQAMPVREVVAVGGPTAITTSAFRTARRSAGL